MEKQTKSSERKKYRSSKYKSSLVLELLRGEPIELLARREGVSVSELTSWKELFVKSGISSFKSKSNKESKELQSAYNVIAKQAMEIALYKKKLHYLSTMPVK